MLLIYKGLHHFTKLIKILRIEPSAPPQNALQVIAGHFYFEKFGIMY